VSADGRRSVKSAALDWKLAALEVCAGWRPHLGGAGTVAVGVGVSMEIGRECVRDWVACQSRW